VWFDPHDLEEKKRQLVRALRRAEKARDEADSRMQSRHDTQKEDYALEADLIRGQIERVGKEIEQLKCLRRPRASDAIAIGHIVTLQIGDDEPCELVLVERFGGRAIGGISTMSVESPIGKAIVGKRAGETLVVKLAHGQVRVRVISLK
jgi:transcription elongation GreA/GreB family factor